MFQEQKPKQSKPKTARLVLAGVTLISFVTVLSIAVYLSGKNTTVLPQSTVSSVSEITPIPETSPETGNVEIFTDEKEDLGSELEIKNKILKLYEENKNNGNVYNLSIDGYSINKEYYDPGHDFDPVDVPATNQFSILKDEQIIGTFESDSNFIFSPVYASQDEIYIVTGCGGIGGWCRGEFSKYNIGKKEKTIISENAMNFFITADKKSLIYSQLDDDFSTYHLFIYNFESGEIIAQSLELVCNSNNNIIMGCKDLFLENSGEIFYIPIDYSDVKIGTSYKLTKLNDTKIEKFSPDGFDEIVFNFISPKVDTTNWIHYNNPNLGFSMLYPVNLKMNESLHPNGDSILGVFLNSPMLEDADVGVNREDIAMRFKDGAYREGDYKTEPSFQEVVAEARRRSSVDFLAEEKNIIISGENAIEFIYRTNLSNLPDDEVVAYEIFIRKSNGKSFSIGASIEPSQQEIYVPIFNQILSTFKFIKTEKQLLLSELKLILPDGWNIKSNSESHFDATIITADNLWVTFKSEKLNSYEEFGSGKYNLIDMEYGQAWSGVSTENSMTIGMSFDSGQYYNLSIDYGDQKITSIDNAEIWEMIKSVWVSDETEDLGL